jgi:subtilisin family serine protease
MLKRFAGVLSCATAAICAAASPASAQQHYILRAPSALADAVVTRHGLTVYRILRDDSIDRIVVVSGPPSLATADIANAVGNDDDVIGFEPDVSVRVPELAASATLSQSTAAILEQLNMSTVVDFFGKPSLSTYATQPAISIIRLPEARGYGLTGVNTVAIIDTGVDGAHPLLQGVMVDGFDFTRDTAGAATDLIDLANPISVALGQSTAAILERRSIVALNQSTAAILEQSTAAILEGAPPLPASFGHGTMVAGLMHLVAPTALIQPLKAFRADGSANMSDIIRAIYYAADHGARVVNMSFSVPDSSQELMRAIDYASSRGAICVAAAGNQAKEMVVYPAGFRNVIGVASTNNLDLRSVFSNFGDGAVTLAAPGELLMTTYPGGRYAAVTGTSFSTALVSGGVALMTQAWGPLTASQALDDLRRSLSLGQSLGLGRLDLFATLAKTLTRK